MSSWAEQKQRYVFYTFYGIIPLLVTGSQEMCRPSLFFNTWFHVLDTMRHDTIYMRYKQYSPFGAKICSDICPRTLEANSFPIEARGKMWTTNQKAEATFVLFSGDLADLRPGSDAVLFLSQTKFEFGPTQIKKSTPVDWDVELN